MINFWVFCYSTCQILHWLFSAVKLKKTHRLNEEDFLILALIMLLYLEKSCICIYVYLSFNIVFALLEMFAVMSAIF